MDLGTGSGVLAIHAARLDANHIVATDINEQILACAQANALRNGVQINFHVSDVFDHVQGQFDFIFANGPIAIDAWDVDMLAGNTIESFGEKLFSRYRNYLNDGGVMFMTFADFGPVDMFYRLAMRHGISQRITCERKYGVNWTCHEIFKN